MFLTSFHKGWKPLFSNFEVSLSLVNIALKIRNYSDEPTAKEVTAILQEKEYSHEFNDINNSVKSYDSNQLGSNDPIEDARSEAKSLLVRGNLFGVFDGHSGPECAQVVANRLLKYISISLLSKAQLENYIHSLEVNEDHGLQLLDEYNVKYELADKLNDFYAARLLKFAHSTLRCHMDWSVVESLERAVDHLDADMLSEALENRLSDGNEMLKQQTLKVAMTGAVCSVAYVDGIDLYVANVGDCEAVLGTLSEEGLWRSKKLTTPHNADNPDEVRRVRAEHPGEEMVITYQRLLGQLMPFRAFGDANYKWTTEQIERYVLPYIKDYVYEDLVTSLKKYRLTPPYLTAHPEIFHHRLTSRDKFLILATDGLWDELSSERAVQLVGEHIYGKAVLLPFEASRDMTLGRIGEVLRERTARMLMKPVDRNAATHLIRAALSGKEYGNEFRELSRKLRKSPNSRFWRDDITVTVVYFDPEYTKRAQQNGSSG